MLTLSEERSEELRSKFVESPIKTLPHLSILQDLKPKAISFDSQLANDVAAKNYFPQILELDLGSSFDQFTLHQVCCDLIQAFQQSHKMTA